MSYSFGMQQDTEIGIKLFAMTQSGTYQEQNLRPFQATVTEGLLNELATATRGGVNVGINAVQNVASQLINPVSMPEGTVGISNGWTSRRFRFLMHVIEKHPLAVGDVINRILFGYTDNCDASLQGTLDPNMRIYFNSETIITEVLQPTVNGMVKKAIVSGSNQIVSPVNYQANQSHYQGSSLYNQSHSILIRPEDVFSMGQTNETIKMLEATGQFTGGVDHRIDVRTQVGQGGEYKYSMRRDTSPSRYLSDLLGGYQHAVKEAALSHNGYEPNEPYNKGLLYGEAQATTANQNIHSNTFLSRLKDYAGYMEKGYVTLRELVQLFPEAGSPQTTKFSMDTGKSIRQVNHADQSMHWNGSEPITIAASLIAQVVPAIMMDNFVRTVSFAATNGMGNSQYRYELHPRNTRMLVDALDTVSYLTEFQRRLFVDILNSVTRNNQIPFSLTVFADLGEDTVIDIALGSEPVRRYVAPTFTDSLFSPMITRKDDALTNLSNGLLYVVSEAIPSAKIAQQQQVYTPQHPQANLQPSAKPSIQFSEGYGLL